MKPERMEETRELVLKGETGPLKFDEVDSMSVKELRAKVRAAAGGPGRMVPEVCDLPGIAANRRAGRDNARTGGSLRKCSSTKRLSRRSSSTQCH